MGTKMSSSLIEAYHRRLQSFDLVEEFYSPSQKRDREGQWTKMWSGVSAHPDHRTKPVKTGDVYPYEIFETDLGGGYSSHVSDYYMLGNDNHIISGVIMKSGKEVGKFSRNISDENGDRVAIHESLEIDPAHHGQGLADRFNTHAVAQYQKIGVDRIELEAGLTVGGYAWARQGYRLKDESEGKRYLFNQLARIEGQLHKPVNREYGKKVHAEVDALRKAIDAGEDVQPIHIASIGEQYARHRERDIDGVEYDTWPGKEVLLNTTWTGVYYFDAAKPVTAAASDLAHAELRPAFKREQPGIVRYVADLIELACHDASCRPPTSGGTGGSTPRYGRGFGGPSAHPTNRTKPMSRLSSEDFTKEGIIVVAKKLWGEHIKIGLISNGRASQSAEVSGDIKNKYGDVIGWFERKLRLSADGVLAVDHGMLVIDDVYQGRNMGSEWNANAIKGYKELGVDHVTVHAADEVGGYAWAREGFRIATPDIGPNNWPTSTNGLRDLISGAAAQLESAKEWNRISKDHYDEATNQLDILYRANEAGEDVQPIHIASIGETTMRYVSETREGQKYDSWPGKDALLGTDWYGVYFFDGNSAVTAALQSDG